MICVLLRRGSQRVVERSTIALSDQLEYPHSVQGPVVGFCELEHTARLPKWPWSLRVFQVSAYSTPVLRKSCQRPARLLLFAS